MVPTLPANERQCRPLTSLEPSQQQQAWVAVIDKAAGATITSGLVSSVVAELFPRSEQEPTDSEEENSKSAEPMTWQEALQAASRKKNITSAEFAHMLGVSSNTGDTRKALHAVARSSGYEIESLKDSFRVCKAPTGQDAIAEIFGGLSPSEKMAQLRRLSGDPDVMRIRGEKQTQEMRKGDKATALEAAAGFIEQAGHELHKYQTNFGAHFGWLSKAMKTEQGVSEVLSMIGRLDRIANDSVAYSRALNERTSDV
jgi:DNA-binding transcriptional regulator YiaG